MSDTDNQPTADVNRSPSDIPTIEAPVGGFVRTLREGPGTLIGAYKLVRLIGEGGFGSVFLAEQEKPVRRSVALKIIKLGMDTTQVVARFEQERQALAILDHPHIAKVFDAGATATGRPYFVMEFCTGEPIDAYCDRNNLSISERLQIFEQVCAAVQHAHTKGLIHRDIKPSNVLVSTQDGKPSAKVIDFGIAKATSSKMTERTVYTEYAQMIGTPEYMSPEQAEGSLDIDTRTDVYSLGVLLYKLLTGVTPFSGKKLRSAAYDEIQRVIREEEPTKPSTRVIQDIDSAAAVAAKRQSNPKKLETIIRGELDWIVMKALEKDRARRYESANGLAADIHRYLTGEAVVAAPPSAAYRLRKFARRNRVIVTAGSAVTAALLVGIIAFAWQASVARDQRDRAVKAEIAAETRADELKLVADFQAGMLEQINTTEAGKALSADVVAKYSAALAEINPPISEEDRMALVKSFSDQWNKVNATDTARDLIDQTILKPAIKTIDEKFKNQPLIDARLRQVLANRYKDLALYDAAMPLQESALATRKRVLGDGDLLTLRSLDEMAILLEKLGRLPEAEKAYREVQKRLPMTGAGDSQDTLAMLSNFGDFLREQGNLAEAEPILRQCLEKCRRVLSEEHRDTLTAMNCLGFVFVMQDRRAEAEPLWREAYEKGRQVLGVDHPDVLIWMNNIAGLLSDLGKGEEAEKLIRRTVEDCRRIRGVDHPITMGTKSTLAGILEDQGRLPEAEAIVGELLEQSRRVLGDDHPDTLHYLHQLGTLLIKQGRFADAEPYRLEVLEKRRRVLGENHPETLDAIHNMGFVLSKQGKYAEAEPFFRDAISRRRNLAQQNPGSIQLSIVVLAEMLDESGKPAESEPLWRELFEMRTALLPAGHWRIFTARYGLGKSFMEQGKFTAAEPVLIEAFEGLSASKDTPRKPTDWLQRPCKCLVMLYESWDKAEPGKGHDAKTAEWKAKLETLIPTEPTQPDAK